METEIEGTVAPGFEEVAEVLRRHLANGLDLGFSCCAYLEGRPVVDLWGGHADRAKTKPWLRDSLVPLTSISKTLLATIVLRLAEAGAVDLDAPIARYWPEFGVNGKEQITVATVLAHRAGIPVFDPPVTLADEAAWTPILARFEAMRPIWPPGSAHGYHAIVLGFLLCELLRRITGQRASDLVQEHLADPLGLDLRMRLGVDDVSRLVEVIPPDGDTSASLAPQPHAAYMSGLSDQTSLLYRATFGSTAMTFEDTNNPAYYTTERPAAYGTAASVARMYAALLDDVDGVRLLGPATAVLARTVRSAGQDRVFAVPTRWGLGFMLADGPLWPEVGSRAFGHIGSTGALAYADPDSGLSFAFLPNKMKDLYEIPDRRAAALVTALAACARRARTDHVRS